MQILCGTLCNKTVLEHFLLLIKYQCIPISILFVVSAIKTNSATIMPVHCGLRFVLNGLAFSISYDILHIKMNFPLYLMKLVPF